AWYLGSPPPSPTATMMARRHVPQPLPLADESHLSPNSNDHLSESIVSSAGVSPVSSSSASNDRALGTGSNSASSRGPRSAAPAIGLATSGETTGLQVVPSPTSSKSSKSPRSPFSRFNPSKKAQQAPQGQLQNPISTAGQQLQPSQSEPTPAAIPLPPLASDISPSSIQVPGAACDHSTGPQLEDDDDDDDFEDDYHRYQQHQAKTRTEYPKIEEPQPQSSRPREDLGHPQSTPQPTPQSTPRPTVPYPTPQQQQQQQSSAREAEKHSRNASRFFNFSGKGQRSGNLHPGRHPSPSRSQNHLPPVDTPDEPVSRDPDYPSMSDRVSSKASKHSDHSSVDPPVSRDDQSPPSRSDISLASGATENEQSQNKSKPFTLINRSRSVKDKNKETSGTKDMASTSTQVRIQEPERAHALAGQQPLRTAPVEPHDRSHRQMINATPRNHSADRAAPRDIATHKEQRRDRDNSHHNNRSHPSSLHNTSGSFFNGLRSSGTRAADIISKGLFGKGVRSGSTTEKEPVVDDEHYQVKVINLPLVEQTRITRISKRLERSKDKTEFWMPAFPWRAIDYLNYKGTDVEGLYRVPGSGPQIKKWQRKFDEEHDVDLFAQDDLYDINIIGSMLKAWLRELPDELFPKEAQERIARECAGAEEVPQLLIDELSNLSPYNYYLLFAITCHLSLLLAHSDKNKMDFRNLCICFQPCMKIDAFCFRFLVCDWRQCWQGCNTEAQFIEEEYALFNSPPPRGYGSDGSAQQGNGDQSQNQNEGRGESPPGSAHQQRDQPQHQHNGSGKLRKKGAPSGTSNGSIGSTSSTISTSLTINSIETPRRSNELRPLSPIKPLSPLGF
ncbi:Rho GTPase activator, partial [Apiospora arundinis]